MMGDSGVAVVILAMDEIRRRGLSDTTMSSEKKSDVSIMSKYHRQVPSKLIDVYDVLKAFQVVNPAVQHAVKKLLCPGTRGQKDTLTDLREAEKSIIRAIELEGRYDKRC